jgi:nucleoside-diphosphate-sugar epimerase
MSEVSTTETVIVTGATGFIGSAVLATLLAAQRRVVVLRRRTSDLRRIAHLSGFESVIAERYDEPGLVEKLHALEARAFIHCAWSGVAGQERNATYQITENVPAVIEAVKLAAASGCTQWMGTGSQAEYGNPNAVISEDARPQPTTLYGKAKLAASIAALALCDAQGISGSWVRVFSTYGPWEADHWFVPYLIREFAAGRAPKLTRCEQLWDYLYVEDAARAIVRLLGAGARGVFNLGSGQATSLRQIVDTTRDLMHCQVRPEYGAVPYREDQVMHLQADISKLRHATGWLPEIDIEEGLRRSVQHFHSQSAYTHGS